jgi:DNA phosphorothioation-associated putative methyltransferase
MRVALDDEIVTPTTTVLDYGCGHGGDVQRLRDRGVHATGWDPQFFASDARSAADIVNLGYVVNVIEDVEERAETLRSAWALTLRVLIVSARLTDEARAADASFRDGCMTRIGTFQKFYEQDELRVWIEQQLGEPAVPAAPGVFYVFRERALREVFVASRYRRRTLMPRIRYSERIYQEHRELFDAVAMFVAQRGRMPNESELAQASELREKIGSLPRAFSILRRVAGSDEWEAIERARTQDLIVYLALSRFSGRPKFSALPTEMRFDVRAFFTSYAAGCDLADALLHAAGDARALADAVKEVRVGKVTPAAVYCHISAVVELPSLLRIYEGCARAYIGSIEGANVVKLHRDAPQVSYLSYPRFDRDPHPALAASVVVPLQTFRIQFRDFSATANPPILHRKETFVGRDYPRRSTFERLTEQEQRMGLLDETATIGTRDGWNERLRSAGVQLRGHRIVRDVGGRSSNTPP